MKITREKFIAATGSEPKQDDLERCNCDKAGQFTHTMCGWNEEFDLPQFMVGIIGYEVVKERRERLLEFKASLKEQT